MNTAPLHKLGRSVTRLGYGAWALSGELGRFDKRTALRSVLSYLECGGNFIDTARAYGDSEDLIAEALSQWHGEPPVIATKVKSRGPARRWGAPWDVQEVFPPGSVRASAQESRRRLGVEVIDILQMHLYWPTWGTSGYWLDELHSLREEGVIRAIGISIPDFRHDVGLPAILAGIADSVQTIVNIFDPLALDCLVPLAAERDIAIIARGALDEGGLTGAITPETTFDHDDIRGIYFAPEHRRQYVERVERLRRYIPEHAPSLPALALKFVANAPGITTTIVSMPDERFVRENVAALEEPPLAPEVLEELRTRHRWVRNFFQPAYWR
jgi:aryl-alcohol dehydrogenase-like predicted oxidoreductase